MSTNTETRSRLHGGLMLLPLLTLACAAPEQRDTEAASATAPTESARSDIPQFRVDPFWARELPNNWMLGQVSGVAVDDRDHVWIVHRPRDARRQTARRGRHVLRAGAAGDRVRPGRERRALVGRARRRLRVAGERARHPRRPPGQRLDRRQRPRRRPRAEVHRRRRVPAADRAGRPKRRQQRHGEPGPPGIDRGRPGRERGLHRRRLREPPRDRVRLRNRGVPAALGSVRSAPGRHGPAAVRPGG